MTIGSDASVVGSCSSADSYSSIGAMFEASCARFSTRDAYTCGGSRLSYAELGRQASAFATWLQQCAGVDKQQRIALMCPNRLEFPVAMFGILKTGAAQVSINPHYTARELNYLLNDADVQTVVVAEKTLSSLLEIIDQTSVRNVVVIVDGEVSLPEKDGYHIIRFSQVMDKGEKLEFAPVSVDADDLAYLQYTGGTTGAPKGAMLTHCNILASVEGLRRFIGAWMDSDAEVAITAIPLYHIFGIQANCLFFILCGGMNRLITNPSDLDGLVDELARAPFTFISGVNTLYNALSTHPRIGEVDFSTLKLSMGGGTPIQNGVAERWRKLTGLYIKEGYGMSEAAGGLSLVPLDYDGFDSSVGIEYHSVSLSLRDDSGHEVKDGEPGEICVKGPMIMKGYWGDAKCNEGIFTEDGFLKTGDIGQREPNGHIRIVDRKKDVILVSGFNVYPVEVENVLSSLPGLYDCACVGVPDEKSGEAVKVFVVCQPGENLTEDALKDYCRQQLAAYKRPKYIEFVDSLPKTAIGKILRKNLRDT